MKYHSPHEGVGFLILSLYDLVESTPRPPPQPWNKSAHTASDILETEAKAKPKLIKQGTQEHIRFSIVKSQSIKH